jgi:hypothetical protein
MRCATQVAACFNSSDATKNNQCRQVRECAEMNRCASTTCYCGSSALCNPPNGPCVSIIHTVVGSTDRNDVTDAADNPEHPLGRSNAVGMCAQSNCASQCGL